MGMWRCAAVAAALAAVAAAQNEPAEPQSLADRLLGLAAAPRAAVAAPPDAWARCAGYGAPCAAAPNASAVDAANLTVAALPSANATVLNAAVGGPGLARVALARPALRGAGVLLLHDSAGTVGNCTSPGAALAAALGGAAGCAVPTPPICGGSYAIVAPPDRRSALLCPFCDDPAATVPLPVTVLQPGLLGRGVRTRAVARVRPEVEPGALVVLDLSAVDPLSLAGVFEANGPATIIGVELVGFGVALDPTAPLGTFADDEVTVEVSARLADQPAVQPSASVRVRAFFVSPFREGAEPDEEDGPLPPFALFGSVLPRPLQAGYLVRTYWHPDCMLERCESDGVAREACAYRVLADLQQGLAEALEEGAEPSVRAMSGPEPLKPLEVADRAVEAYRTWVAPAVAWFRTGGPGILDLLTTP